MLYFAGVIVIFTHIAPGKEKQPDLKVNSQINDFLFSQHCPLDVSPVTRVKQPLPPRAFYFQLITLSLSLSLRNNMLHHP